MPKITFRDSHGVDRSVDAETGYTLMEVAKLNGIPEIEADCGGACACATCHVFVADAFLEKVGKPTESEKPMLEFVEGATHASRLACQIRITEALEGLEVTTPVSQY